MFYIALRALPVSLLVVGVIPHFEDFFDFCFMCICALWHVHRKLWVSEEDIKHPGTGTYGLPDAGTQS